MADGPAAEHRRVDPVGFVLVIASALCYSALGILGKVAFAEGLPLLSLLALRFSIAAAILWCAVALAPGLRVTLARLPRRTALWLFLLGVFGFAGQAGLFFSTLQRLSASLTEVLLYTCPAFLALLVWLRTGRTPASSRLAAIAIALLGTWLCAGRPAGAGSTLGVGLGLATGLWYAVFVLMLDRLSPHCPGALAATLIVSGAAVAFDATALAAGGFVWPTTPLAWAAVLGLVACATLLGFVLFVVGVKRVGPQVASILSTFEPVGTLGLAAVLLGERLTPGQWAGAALIIGAAFVLAAVAETHDRLAPLPAPLAPAAVEVAANGPALAEPASPGVSGSRRARD